MTGYLIKKLRKRIKALEKRLKEQEEMIALLKAYERASIGVMTVHGFDAKRWREEYEKDKVDG